MAEIAAVALCWRYFWAQPSSADIGHRKARGLVRVALANLDGVFELFAAIKLKLYCLIMGIHGRMYPFLSPAHVYIASH